MALKFEQTSTSHSLRLLTNWLENSTTCPIIFEDSIDYILLWILCPIQSHPQSPNMNEFSLGAGLLLYSPYKTPQSLA